MACQGYLRCFSKATPPPTPRELARSKWGGQFLCSCLRDDTSVLLPLDRLSLNKQRDFRSLMYFKIMYNVFKENTRETLSYFVSSKHCHVYCSFISTNNTLPCQMVYVVIQTLQRKPINPLLLYYFCYYL